jgi:hypothetical protein
LHALDSSARAIAVRHGYGPDARPTIIEPDAGGVRHVRTAQLERVVVDLDPGHGEGAAYRGYTVDGDTLRDLPVGSHLDVPMGEFAWAPGLAFGGIFDLLFVRTPSHVGTDHPPSPSASADRHSLGGGGPREEQIRVRVAIDAQPWSAGERGLVIDTPRAGASLPQPFTVAGWAIDPNGPANGAGIDTLHVWAYPVDPAGIGDSGFGIRTGPNRNTEQTSDGIKIRSVSDGGRLGVGPRAPVIFVGVAAYGGLRPDVADLFGPRFARSGFGIDVAGLPPGDYDIVVYAHSIVDGFRSRRGTPDDGFTIARTVRVSVR